MRYKVIYSSTTLVDLYIQLPDFPQFADASVEGSPEFQQNRDNEQPSDTTREKFNATEH